MIKAIIWQFQQCWVQFLPNSLCFVDINFILKITPKKEVWRCQVTLFWWSIYITSLRHNATLKFSLQLLHGFISTVVPACWNHISSTSISWISCHKKLIIRTHCRIPLAVTAPSRDPFKMNRKFFNHFWLNIDPRDTIYEFYYFVYWRTRKMKMHHR